MAILPLIGDRCPFAVNKRPGLIPGEVNSRGDQAGAQTLATAPPRLSLITNLDVLDGALASFGLTVLPTPRFPQSIRLDMTMTPSRRIPLPKGRMHLPLDRAHRVLLYGIRP